MTASKEDENERGFAWSFAESNYDSHAPSGVASNTTVQAAALLQSTEDNNHDGYDPVQNKSLSLGASELSLDSDLVADDIVAPVGSTSLSMTGNESSLDASRHSFDRQDENAISEMTNSAGLTAEEANADINKPDTTHCPIVLSTEKTIRFNCMVAGQSGAGKSTFCYTTFRRHFPNFKMVPPNGPTRQVGEVGRGDLIIGDTRVILTVIDTVGYEGDNSINRLKDIVRFLDEQAASYEQNELYRNSTDQSMDSRIHCLFYFFSPHRVHETDLVFLRQLQDRVPIVPIISKADSLTTEELANQLKLLRTHSAQAEISYFDFRECGVDEAWLQAPFNPSAFARVGLAMSKSTVVSPEASVRRPMIKNAFAVISGSREYPWGLASEGDPNHSDTSRLHTVLFGNFGELVRAADEIHDQWRLNCAKTSWARSIKNLWSWSTNDLGPACVMFVTFACMIGIGLQRFEAFNEWIDSSLETAEDCGFGY